MMRFRGSDRGAAAGRGQPRKRASRGRYAGGPPPEYWASGEYNSGFGGAEPRGGPGGYMEAPYRGGGRGMTSPRGRGFDRGGGPFPRGGFRGPYRGGPPPMYGRGMRFPRGPVPPFGPPRGPYRGAPFQGRGGPFARSRPYGRGGMSKRGGASIGASLKVSATHFEPPKDGTIITAKFGDGFPCYHEALSKILELAPVVRNCAGSLTVHTTPENMRDVILKFREKFDSRNELSYNIIAPRRVDPLCKYVYIKGKVEDDGIDEFCTEMAKLLEALTMEPIKKTDGSNAKCSYLLKYETQEKAALCQQKTYAYKDQTLYIRPYFRMIPQQEIKCTTVEPIEQAATEDAATS